MSRSDSSYKEDKSQIQLIFVFRAIDGVTADDCVYDG